MIGVVLGLERRGTRLAVPVIELKPLFGASLRRPGALRVRSTSTTPGRIGKMAVMCSEKAKRAAWRDYERVDQSQELGTSVVYVTDDRLDRGPYQRTGLLGFPEYLPLWLALSSAPEAVEYRTALARAAQPVQLALL